ncbi:MAG: DUF4827 family protein [Muribaculaceae bacterium]|nr:DUF4827 family protein [Muribaculaceae bacterium]
MKRHLLHTLSLALGTAAVVALGSCSDKRSYADLLSTENQSVNAFLVNQNVYLDIPADTVFQVGKDAPYYRLDEEGNLYMQVINAGTPRNRVESDQLIYFRFTRWNLNKYASTGELGDGEGNSSNVNLGSASFRYGNYTLTSSSQWGAGLQTPLQYLPIDCEVNIIIKSQYGVSTEIANVVPYLYNVRYFPAVSN